MHAEPATGQSPERGSWSRATARGAAWALAAQAAAALASLIGFVVMSRLVEPGELGQYLLAAVAVGAVQWLALNAYREPVIQALSLTPAMRDSVFWFSAGVATVLAAALQGIAWYLWRTQAGITAACLSLLALKVFFDTLVSVPMALCYRELRFRSLAIAGIGVSSLALALNLALLLYAGWGVFAVAASQGAASALMFALVLSRSGWLPRAHFAWQDLAFLRRYAPHVVLWQGVEALNLHFDRFLVGTRLSPQALGVYGFGRRLNEIVIEVLAGAAGNVALPTFATLQNDLAALRRAYLRAMRIVTFAVFPVIGILYGLAEELVTALFGARWAPAVPIYQIFLLLGAIQTAGILQAALIRSLGHANLWARYQLMQALANLMVLYFAVDHGIYVLAVAVVARTYLVWSYAVWTTCRLLELRVLDYLRILLKPALGAMLACVVAKLALHLSAGMPPIAVIVGAAAFGGLAYLATALLTMKPVADDLLGLIARRG